jgi:hypothetical protein
MTLRFDRDAGDWVSLEEWYARRQSDEPMSDLPRPYVAGDIKPYLSPLGTGEITSRSHRREELKRHDCREVDPSEWKPQQPVKPRAKWARKHAQTSAS